MKLNLKGKFPHHVVSGYTHSVAENDLLQVALLLSLWTLILD